MEQHVYFRKIIRFLISKGVLLVNLVLVISLVAACNDKHDGIKKIEVNNKIAHFIIFYPNRYDKEGPYFWSNGGLSSELSLLANKAKITMDSPNPAMGSVNVSRVLASIDIDIFESVDNRNALAQLEFILGKENEDPDFKLLDRSHITISGIDAEQAIYHAPNPLPFKGLPDRLVRQIYFDHNGYVWEISYFSEVSISDIVSADFEYILSTFKIID